jgi:hypothetical protein
MKIYELSRDLSKSVQSNLSDFEQQFVYPLGPHSTFRIEHGPDYTAFYRAIGEPITVAAEIDGKIVGVISIAIRNISIDGRASRYAYIGDLKIHPTFQSGAVLFKLARFLQPLLLAKSVDFAYGVVMDGTSRAPASYSGRVGIPLFKNVGKVHILRITTSSIKANQAAVTADVDVNAYRRLNAGGTLLDIANAGLRSEISPKWLEAGGTACGLVEDTRRAKRLYLSDGSELLSAHLSYFSFCDATSALSLLNQAVNWAFEKDFPAMFVGLSPMQKHLLEPVLGHFKCEESMATIYATNDICSKVAINTAEI